MIAILIATGRNDAFQGLQELLPIPLLPLADRPFLQHVIEYVANKGLRRFEFVLSHLPEKIEAALGDGARWGCAFHYHLLPAGGDPLRLARTIAAGTEEAVLFGTAERLPEFNLTGVPPTTLIFRAGVWSGWGVFTLRDFLVSNLDSLRRVESIRYLSIETGLDFLLSQKQVLERSFPGLLISGKEADPGIWISRNVVLHPTVKLSSPVYIGENCRIGRGAQIGPFAVIGPNCIVNEHTFVLDSMVAAGTYVGEGLELDSVIVDRNCLFNIRLQTTLLASEAFLLGSLSGRAPGRSFYRIGSLFVALIVLLFLWPVLLLTGLILSVSRHGTFIRDKTVRIPADDDSSTWCSATQIRFRVKGLHGKAGEFLYTFLPGLISVLMGDLFLVGVKPRTRSQILELPSDWRALYLKTKAGLITEAAVMFGPTPSMDEFYTAEAFYSAKESIGHDCRLLGLWFLRLILSAGKTGVDLANDSTVS